VVVVVHLVGIGCGFAVGRVGRLRWWPAEERDMSEAEMGGPAGKRVGAAASTLFLSPFSSEPIFLRLLPPCPSPRWVFISIFFLQLLLVQQFQTLIRLVFFVQFCYVEM
jgi:hypothetical protein